ncbi:glycosyltransferase [Flavobacterium sufflavum]|uniref:Glycosyltransferase n=1 Tax=Flavobacterium sufflavum TaxID=1921138 RepID=A0A437KUL1_9FLAO|nr:glycosyltransferase family 2 protein [Flavobacterium sufflavum]RVT75880.1 glycosyltransferase [Flavobacterium sufflavum]
MLKLSIITINYNNASGLQRTVESVISQRYSDMEYIVVDGDSTDDSVSVIKKHESSIDKWVSEKDNGIYNALNKGIQMATGDYLLFLNSGDHFYDSDILYKIQHHIRERDLIAFDIHMLGLGHDFIHKHPDELLFSFLFEETFAHQSVFIKRSLFDKIGLYDENLKIVADWKFFIHAVASGCSYKSVHEVLTVFYFDGISSTAEGTFLRRKERESVLKSEFSIFYKDYIELRKLKMNRFKMLSEIEKTTFGKKTMSVIFRIYILLFSKKKLEDIIN